MGYADIFLLLMQRQENNSGDAILCPVIHQSLSNPKQWKLPLKHGMENGGSMVVVEQSGMLWRTIRN